MLKMSEKAEESSSISAPLPYSGGAYHKNNAVPTEKPGVWGKVVNLFSPRPDTTLRETIEGYIEEDDNGKRTEPSISAHEKTLISNVLELRDMMAMDVMIPRADIIAISHDTNENELLALLSERQYSRIPVYKDTLDNVIGTVHVKDILATLARGEHIDLKALTRDIPIISPAMHVLDLLLQMRITKKHMVLVVDEFGGIDGLVTIGDVIEAIVGEIDDEYTPDGQPEIITHSDGSITVDARLELYEFEEIFGQLLNEEEREDNDTLGGLVFYLAGRVPARGEILKHESGMKFEVLDADPRRVNRLSIHNIPSLTA